MKAEAKEKGKEHEERRERRKKKEEADKDAKRKKELDGGIEGGSRGSMKQEEEEEQHKDTKEENCVKDNRARVDEETLSNMKVPELRDLCDRLKVKKAGKKQDLIARLLHAEAEANDKKEGLTSEVTTTGKQEMDKSEKEEIKGKEQATEQSVKENSNGLSAKSKRAAKKTKKKGKDEGGGTESKGEEVAVEEMKQERGGEDELLRKKKVTELRALCESMQIKATGTKEELITRLCDHKKKNPKADVPHTEGEKERKRKREDSKHVGTTEDLHAAPDSKRKRIAKRRKVDKVEKDEKRKQNEAKTGDSKENTVEASKKVKQDSPRKTGRRRSEEEEEKKATVEEKEVLLVEGEEEEEAAEESKQTGESEHAVVREERLQKDGIQGKTVAELKQLLKQHNLKVGGSKGDLIQRLSDHLASTSVASPSQPTKTSPAAGVKGNSGASPVRNEKATTVNNKNKSNNKNKRKTPESEQVPADGEIRRPSDADADDVAVVDDDDTAGNNSSRPAVRVAKRRKQGAVNNKKQKKEKKPKEEAVAAVMVVNERERKASGGGNKVVVGGGDAAAQQSKRPVLAPARRIGLARRGVPSLHQATLASGKQK